MIASINTKLLDLRNEYSSCLKLANETDSKKEDKILRQEARDLLSKLQKICIHEHTVCLMSEYEGSYTDDYSDKCPEYRICLCCGLAESAYHGKFDKLITKPFSRFEGKYPDQIKNPLSYLLYECIEIANKEGYTYHKNMWVK